MIKNIGIIGTGGVGGYFGAKLCQARHDPQAIHFLARGPHLDAIRTEGLTVKTVSEGTLTCHPDMASDQVGEFPLLDFCLITVKGYDLTDTVTALKEKTSRDTIILPLLNGIDIDKRVREIIPDARVLPGCAYISSHIERPGLVVQTGGSCSIIFGRDPRHPDFYPEEVMALFDAADISHQFAENPYSKIWEKYLFIAPFSLVTACFDKTVGEVIASPRLSQYVKDIMEEIAHLADKMNVDLPDDITINAFEKAKNFPFDTRTSFQNDFSKPGRKDEREIFGGTILKLCDEAKLPCPTTREIYRRLNEVKPFLEPNGEHIH